MVPESRSTWRKRKARLSLWRECTRFSYPTPNYLKESEENIRELENAVWRSGTYWQPSMQTMDEQVANLPQRWETYLKSFEKEIAEHVPKTNDIGTVGKRLQKVAVAIGNEAFPFDVDDIASVPDRLRKQRTIAHGDPKGGQHFLERIVIVFVVVRLRSHRFSMVRLRSPRH